MSAGQAQAGERIDSVEVLGVCIHCLDMPAILERVLEWSVAPARRTVLYVNAHCLNIAVQDAAYRKILNAADLVYTDGISVVWASRLLGGCRLHKMTGADWIDQFCRFASPAPASPAQAEPWGAGRRALGGAPAPRAAGLRLYLLAGKPGIAHRAAARLHERYPRLEIVGACDGYFQEKSQDQALAEIIASQADVVFIGRGTPVQEKWIAAHRDEIPAPVCWAVGALFDYVAGVEPRAPAWMKAIALEWLWRLMMDPRGKWRRYLLGNPLFMLRLLRQVGQRW